MECLIVPFGEVVHKYREVVVAMMVRVLKSASKRSSCPRRGSLIKVDDFEGGHAMDKKNGQEGKNHRLIGTCLLFTTTSSMRVMMLGSVGQSFVSLRSSN